jgi:hypothetical protein
MKQDYGSLILKLRTKLNISQEELARLLGVSVISVNRWENGHFAPTKLVKERIKELLNENNIGTEDK